LSSKKKPASNYCLTPDEIKVGISLCREKVISLLDMANNLVTQGDREISSGLYTYAVEELGKLLLLKKELDKKPNNNKISVNLAIFGRGEGKHPTIKFDEFQKELTIPIACKEVRCVIGGVPITQHLMIDEHLTPINTGIIPVYDKVLMDFLLRQRIFYVDRDMIGWVRHQDIEISDLQKAILQLKNWMVSNTTIF
jgi:hypothetical protein